jgi:hypothetical protein
MGSRGVNVVGACPDPVCEPLPLTGGNVLLEAVSNLVTVKASLLQIPFSTTVLGITFVIMDYSTTLFTVCTAM